MNASAPLDMPQSVRFTIDEFLLLDRCGALERFAKTELIDGEIVVLNAQYSEHFTVKTRLLRRLADACDALLTGLEAWAEGTIAIPPDNLPEPNVFVTTATPVTGLVSVDTVALVVEVASSTLRRDLGRKAELYATAGVAEYWVVDVDARVIHQMWIVHDGRYRQSRRHPIGEPIQAETIPDLTIATANL